MIGEKVMLPALVWLNNRLEKRVYRTTTWVLSLCVCAGELEGMCVIGHAAPDEYDNITCLQWLSRLQAHPGVAPAAYGLQTTTTLLRTDKTGVP
jgi:hypothetical protein